MQSLPSVPFGFEKWNIWVKLSHVGFKVDPNKIKSMKEWPIPKLRGFLRLISYYHQFVNNHGQTIEPLTSLLMKEAFSWTQKETKSFEIIRGYIYNSHPSHT